MDKQWLNYKHRKLNNLLGKVVGLCFIIFVTSLLFLAAYGNEFLNPSSTLEHIGLFFSSLVISLVLTLIFGIVYYVIGRRKILYNYVHYKVTGDKERFFRFNDD